MNIGDRLKAQREKIDVTLEYVAQIVGVSRQTIQKYESGVVKNIPSDKILLLSRALKTSPIYIMGWEDFYISPDDEKEKKLTTVSDDELRAEFSQMFEKLSRGKQADVVQYLRYLCTTEEQGTM